MSNKSNVTAAKPKVGGAVSWAAVGTALPTDATTALNAAFVNVGYISEDGVKNASSPESTQIKAWGGDYVLTTQNGRPDTFTFTMIEVLNANAQKLIHGDSAVSGTLSTGVTVSHSAQDLGEHSFVIEMVLRGGILQRIVIPSGAISEIGEISYTDSGATGYQITILASPDASGNSHYEYYKQPTTVAENNNQGEGN